MIGGSFSMALLTNGSMEQGPVPIDVMEIKVEPTAVGAKQANIIRREVK